MNLDFGQLIHDLRRCHPKDIASDSSVKALVLQKANEWGADKPYKSNLARDSLMPYWADLEAYTGILTYPELIELMAALHLVESDLGSAIPEKRSNMPWIDQVDYMLSKAGYLFLDYLKQFSYNDIRAILLYYGISPDKDISSLLRAKAKNPDQGHKKLVFSEEGLPDPIYFIEEAAFRRGGPNEVARENEILNQMTMMRYIEDSEAKERRRQESERMIEGIREKNRIRGVADRVVKGPERIRLMEYLDQFSADNIRKILGYYGINPSADWRVYKLLKNRPTQGNYADLTWPPPDPEYFLE